MTPEKPDWPVAFYRRLFLNKPGWHSSAFVIARIDHGDTYPTLNIADCDRTVKFALDGDTQEERDNSLQKIDRLYEAIRDFRKALKAEWKKNPAKA